MSDRTWLIDDSRHREVWLGDIVRVGAGKTSWTVIAAERKRVRVASPKGAKRWHGRGQVTLIHRCPDGLQLEEWPDGRAYLGAELVLATRSLSQTVVWWRDEPDTTGRTWGNGVSLTVTAPSQRDGGQRLLDLNTFGLDEGGALLPREHVLELAAALLRISEHI